MFSLSHFEFLPAQGTAWKDEGDAAGEMNGDAKTHERVLARRCLFASSDRSVYAPRSLRENTPRSSSSVQARRVADRG